MELWLLPSQAAIERLDLPGWTRRLALADRLEDVRPGLDVTLATALGLTRSIPWAALLMGAEAAGAHTWLVADLVHVRAELMGARMMACAVDARDADRVHEPLFDAVRPWLAEEGIEIVELRAGRALLRCPPELGNPDAPAPDTMLGADLREGLPADLHWQRRLNELQIVLTQHPLNEARVARGMPAWNSLWFWGHGCMDDFPRVPRHQLQSADPLLLALNRAIGGNRDGAQTWRDLRDPRELARAWGDGVRPRDAIMRAADGAGWRMRPLHRLRVWR